LFPAAIQHVITEANLSQVKAKYLIEGANNPCSDAVRLALHALGKLVIPDFIANPGGIIAAFVELTSSVTTEENIRSQAKVKEAISYTREKISLNVRDVLSAAIKNDVAPLLAARHLALSRMFAI
jgi:glutamate dehydrogenase (NAD(P)+)